MVSSLAALIPQPTVDRSRSTNADSNPDRAERTADDRQPAFGDMIATRRPLEPRKPLPPRAADRAEEARSRALPPRGEAVSAEAHARNEARATASRSERPERPDPARHDEAPRQRSAEGDTGGDAATDKATRNAGREVASKAVAPAADESGLTPAEAEIAMIEDEVVAALLEDVSAEFAETDGEMPENISIEILPDGAEADGTDVAVAISTMAKAVSTEATAVVAANAQVPVAKQAITESGAGADESMIDDLAIGSGKGGATTTAKAANELATGVQNPQTATEKTASGMPVNSQSALASPGLLNGEASALAGAPATGIGESKPEAAKAPAILLAEPVKARSSGSADAPSRAGFADWMQEFAHAQGAIHRSGDLVGSLDRAAHGLSGQVAGQDALRPTPLQMLPIEIGMQAIRGVTTFQIRLDPDELGRVDVKLEIHESGEVEASLVVDRVETLAMLRRDASTLQQAFEQAGFKQGEGGLQFSLRGESQGREGQRDDRQQRHGLPGEDQQPIQNQIAEIAMRRMMIPNSSIDRIV